VTAGGRLDPVELGLPHRDPFLFVDAILELIPGESATGQKTFAAGDPIFEGHFPGNPIIPGVILVEALAQTAGLAVAKPGERLLLSAIRGMKFPASCGPEEVITLKASKAGGVAGLVQCEVSARVGERVVAQGSIVLSATRG